MHVLAWQEAFGSIGKHVERDVIHGQIGKGADMLIPALFPDLDDGSCQALAEAHAAIFTSQYLGKAKPFPGARSLLAHVHGCGQRVVLASSASSSELEHYLKLLGVQDIVAATTSSDDVEQTKPAPDIFAVAMRKLPGIEVGQVIVVGDTPYDMEAASNCGIAAIGLLSGGFSDTVLREAGAVAIYDDVASLLADYERSLLGKLQSLDVSGQGKISPAELDRPQNREVEDEMIKLPDHDGEPPIPATEPYRES